MTTRTLSSLSLSFAFALSLGMAAGACEDVTHENIDKWSHTEKGPGKLRDALKDSEHSADLRAHAAQKLIEIGRFAEVTELLEAMDEAPRHKVMAPLATRLWDMARINDAMAVPNSRQTSAKDALYYSMDLADPDTRVKMADYLVEWFVGGHYEGRATTGSVSGALAIRKIGEPAAGRLLNKARGIVAAPPDAQGRRDQVGDELLKGLALTGNKEVLEFMLELFKNPRGDTSLAKRVVSALYFAYVEPLGMEPANGKALLAISDALEKMPYDSSLSGTTRNDAAALLAAIGPPECIPMFTRMVSYPTEQERFRWMGTQNGLRCSGAKGIEAITEALPVTVPYQRGMLSKYLWDEILKIEDKGQIAAAAAHLLRSESWVARVTGVEILGALGKGAGSDNVELIKGLTGDSRRLKNWWGPQEKVPKQERKAEPTLGEVAANVAKSLDKLASGGASK